WRWVGCSLCFCLYVLIILQLLHSLFQPGYTTLWPYGCHVSVSRTRPSHPSHAPPFLATPCGSDPVPPVVTGSSGAQRFPSFFAICHPVCVAAAVSIER
ncbi:hypothetical protein CSPX01_17336, partial [Colletotrichum filicis]